MRNISKNRRNEIKQAVLKIFAKPEFCVFPVPVIEIANSLPNCILETYSEFAQKRGISLEYLIKITQSQDACSIYDAKYDRHIILYNDTNKMKMISNRYRWSIAHEIGHVVLRHQIDRPDCILCRSSITPKDYKYLEEEADLFANYLLVPYIAIAVRAIDTPEKLKKLCQISTQASNFQFSEYQKWQKNQSFKSIYDMSIASAFYKYRKCYKCEHVFIKKTEQRFCPACGHDKFYFYHIEKGIVMKYYSVELNNYYKSKICPVCGNENTEIDGDYCQICGKMIANRCPDEDCAGNIGLDGDARFCPYCGMESTFLQNGILKPWNFATKNATKTTVEPPKLPFNF